MWIGYLTPGVKSDPVQLAGGAAILDVAAALGWVRKNVAAFGGDPRRVTLAGHSAGAALVNALLMMPDSKGNMPIYVSYNRCTNFAMEHMVMFH